MVIRFNKNLLVIFYTLGKNRLSEKLLASTKRASQLC